MNAHDRKKGSWRTGALAVIAVLTASLTLGTFTTLAYVQARGLRYLDEGNQIVRHQRMMAGDAGNPWQYRVLSAYLVEGLIWASRAVGLPRPHVWAFISFRIAADAAIFLAAVVYFRRLGISMPHAIIGIMTLAWGMSYSHYDSDLQFSTFVDVVFYLLAGTAIVCQRPLWVVVITALGALNRETSGLIPLMYLVAALAAPPTTQRVKAVWVCGLSMGLYVLIFIGLRLAYGEQALIVPYGHAWGLPLIRYNLFRGVTWWQCFATLGIVPLLALVGYRSWPAHVRVFFWVVVPAWFLIHLVGAVMAESRLLLVPQALVFIPGALIFAQQAAGGDARDGAPQP